MTIPIFRIAPVIAFFGGDEMPEGYGWRATKCPFHPDSDASASINTTDQLFNCHASDCPKGTATQVLMKAEGINLASAIDRAEEIAGQGAEGVRQSRRRSGGPARGAGNRSGGRSFRRSGRRS